MATEEVQTDLEMRAEISLYYDLFVPDELVGPAPLLIAVHGYGAHKRYMMREARLVAPKNFVIASIQGPHQHFRPTEDGYRVGFGWLTDHKPDEYVRLHHKFILDVIDKLDREGKIDPSQVYLYGFSQSCALNFRFGFTFPEALKGIVGVCGGIPGDIDTSAIYKPTQAATLYIYGDADEFYPIERFKEFDKKLSERLTNYRSKQFAVKHEITDQMRDEIRRFLTE